MIGGILQQLAIQQPQEPSGNPYADMAPIGLLSAILGQNLSNAAPIDWRVLGQQIEGHRNNGGRADLNRPVVGGPAPSYGIRPAIMDQFLPDFGRYQPRSIE